MEVDSFITSLSLSNHFYAVDLVCSLETREGNLCLVTEKEPAGSKITGLQDRLSKRMGDFKQRFELIPHYNWDFDNYLEEDVPSAVR